jgi:hypothetical protein
MKKVIAILVVLTMALGFSITALADDVEVLPPVDPGDWVWDDETLSGSYENLDFEFDNLPEDAMTNFWGINTENWEQENWDDFFSWEEYDLEFFMDTDVSEGVAFDAFQTLIRGSIYEADPEYLLQQDYLRSLWDDLDTTDWTEEDWDDWRSYVDELWDEFYDYWFNTDGVWPYTGVSGVSGWVTISNNDWGNNTIKAILQWVNGLDEDDEWFGEFRLITDFYLDTDGSLRIRVEDFGTWSAFWALLEKAGLVANERSPGTADNSIHFGIILLIVLSAAVTTFVVAKKVRNKN